MPNNKLANVKTWIKDHTDEIAIGAVFTGLTAAVIAVTIYAVKEQREIIEDDNRRRKEYVDFMNEALSKGTQIFSLLDGTYLSVDREGNKKLVYIV